MEPQDKYKVIVLMAGKSSRFGQPKAFLPFNKDRNFIQNLLFQYREAGIEEIILVTNVSVLKELEKQLQENLFDGSLKIVINPEPESDRFFSLKLALKNMDICCSAFIQNIDNPFISSELISKMRNKIKPGKYVVPSFLGKKGHPVLLSKEILQYLSTIMSDSENLKEILAEFAFEEVFVDDESVLANINTKEDYFNYFNYAIPV